MEIRLAPEVEAKLERMVRETGRPSGELLEDAVLGLFDELTHARELIDRRYDELETGSVLPTSKLCAQTGKASIK